MTATDLITAYVQARRDLAALAMLRDPHLTPEGVQAQQVAAVAAIRERITGLLPAAQEAPDRGPVLDALQPKTADDHARLGREREKVRAMMDAGRRLEHIIANADRTRLAAIADDLEVMPAILALDPADQAAVVAEYRDVLWDRLTMVDPAALAIQEEERTALEPTAWRAVLTDLAEAGEASVESLGLLHHADRDAYRLLSDGDRVHIDVPGSGNGIRYMLEGLERVTA